MFELHTIALDDARADASAGSSNPIKIAIIAITTNSSMSVKPVLPTGLTTR